MKGDNMAFGPRRKKDFFDFEDEFDRIRNEMEEMFEKAFKTPAGSDEIKYGPKVNGFEEEREPLVDVVEEDDTLTVILEMPGVSRDEIGLDCTKDSLSIKVDNPKIKYSKTVKLPVKVKPNTAKMNYKNGILEVRLDRVGSKKSDKKFEIKVS